MTIRTHEHEYVLGFAFDHLTRKVCLIRKLRPEWQCGKLNGVGGSLERDEDGVHAMRREFREETGVDIEESRWRLFACLDTLYPGVARIWLFTVDLEPGEAPRTCEDEEIFMVPVAHLLDPNADPDLDPTIDLGPDLDTPDNLNWMLSMAQAEPPVYAEVQEV